MPVRMSYIVVASLNYVITPFTLLNIYHTQYILGTSGVIVTVLSVALMIGCRPTLAYLLYLLIAEVKCAGYSSAVSSELPFALGFLFL